MHQLLRFASKLHVEVGFLPDKLPCDPETLKTIRFPNEHPEIKGTTRATRAVETLDPGVSSKGFISEDDYQKITTQAGLVEAGCAS
jgi:hypothetical protein